MLDGFDLILTKIRRILEIIITEQDGTKLKGCLVDRSNLIFDTQWYVSFVTHANSFPVLLLDSPDIRKQLRYMIIHVSLSEKWAQSCFWSRVLSIKTKTHSRANRTFAISCSTFYQKTTHIQLKLYLTLTL